MFIRAVSGTLPSRMIENSEAAAWCSGDELFLQGKVGIHRRYWLNADETQLALAEKACRALFEENSDLRPENIELLIFIGQVQEQPIPHLSALLQYNLGMPKRSACFDLSLACSGYVYALGMAKAMMVAGDLRNALVVTCDPYSLILDTRDRNTAPLFGDAATATWLTSRSGGIIGNTVYGTDGEKSRYLYTETGDTGPRLRMNGRGIFNFAMKTIPDAVEQCLINNALAMEDIDIFLFHQANAFILSGLAARLGLPLERVPITMQDVGNTVSSSIPLSLAHIGLSNLQNRQVLLCGFGGGLSWAATVVTFSGGNQLE